MNKSEKNILESMRQDAIRIFNQGLKAVDPKTCIKRHCRINSHFLTVKDRQFDLDQFDAIWVLGAGKAAASMGAAIEEILGDRIAQGLVIVKYDHVEQLNHIKIVEAGHPIPDENGLTGSRQLLDMTEKADEKTLVINLISGGGSALMALPADGLSLTDKQEITQVLLQCGATIHEINTIRKHLSGIKGGRLAASVYPATMICLALSDVVGDDLDIISSGPGVGDPSTFDSCLDIIKKYGIEAQVPENVFSYLEKGTKGLVPETPKPGDDIFRKVYHTIVASNLEALLSSEQMAGELGYQTLVLSALIEGETKDVAGVHTAIARQVKMSGHPLKTPACILSGGETTVTLHGNGKGGRNQEFALACVNTIQGIEHIVVLSGGTDGTDGPTDAAGAVVDHTTFQRAVNAGLSPEAYLTDNNAYPFFDRTGDLIKTGATKTNVMDLRIILIK